MVLCGYCPKTICRKSKSGIISGIKEWLSKYLYFQHLFEVRIDDIQHIVSDPIDEPGEYTDVQVYAAKENPADALIRNFDFDPDPDGLIKVEQKGIKNKDQ